jgi:hypothetical protein
VRSLHKPGCFGSPLAYRASHLCNACPHNQGCQIAAGTRAETLRERYGITAAVAQTRASLQRKAIFQAVQSPPAVPPALVLVEGIAIPKKGLELLERWQAKGVNLKDAVEKEINPFRTLGGFMDITFRMLIAGGFTRQELRAAFVKDLGWTESSASSHAGFAIPLLLATGAAVERSGRITPFNL